MADITNDTQLQQAIEKDIQIAIDRTIIRLLEELQKQIETVVYDAGDPVRYQRTKQFLNMWKGNPSVIMGDTVVGEISPDYGILKTNKNKHQHNITGEALVNLIIQGVGNKDMWYSAPRDFWDEFEDYVDRNIDKIFTEEMEKVQGNSTLFVNFG